MKIRIFNNLRNYFAPSPEPKPAPKLRAKVNVNGVELERFRDFSNKAYKSLSELLGDCIPDRRYERMNPAIMANNIFPRTGSPAVLDVGCGSAQSFELFQEINSDVQWSGVEIAETYNIADLGNLPSGVQIYDGTNIPCDDETFDFCYSKQVFEHVRHPEVLLDDINRVLKPGGTFFGSLSGGEPYHWHSLFNLTALGWKTVLEDHGIQLKELYSGIDALTLLLHHWAENRLEMGDEYFANPLINTALYKETGKGPRTTKYENTLKLVFAGHLVFRAEKPQPDN